MTPQHHLPADIERTSFHIITEELEMMGLTPPPEHEAVVKRVIHTTADFDYARNLRFTPRAVEQAVKALHAGAVIVTDTNMALAGITKPGLAKLGGTACCYMADPEVAAAAKEAGYLGERNVTTWREHLRVLKELGFIDYAAGLAGPCQFVLLLNPYHAVKALHEKGWVQQEAYTTLFQRAQEIGATDLDEDDDEL